MDRVRWIRCGQAACLLAMLLGGAVGIRAAADDEDVQVYCGRCREPLTAAQWEGSRCPACQVEWNGQQPTRESVTTVTKLCSACGKSVPSNSRPGQHCPHCGAYWARQHNSTVDETDDEVDVSHRILIKARALERRDTTLVPLRALRPLAVNLAWDEARHTATVSREGLTLRVVVGESEATLSSGAERSTVAWAVEPRQVAGTVFVPLRGVCEALKLVVDYDNGTILLGNKCALRPLR